MSRGLWTLWLVVLGLAAAGLALTAPAAARAHRRMESELATLATAKAHAAEIARLRGQSPPWADRRAPRAGLATRVTEALAVAGLEPTAVASLSAEAETDADGGVELKARRRRAVLTLAGVTLPQVGGFLSSWRELEPDWTVASVELAPETANKPPAGGGDLPLRATVALEALYVAQEDRGVIRR